MTVSTLTAAALHQGWKRTGLVILLTVLAASSSWMHWINREERDNTPPGSTGPDYYLKKFTITTTAPNGAAQYVVKADYMEYISGQKTVTFLQPQLLFNDSGSSSWSITGKRALVTDEGRQIMMQGRVEIEQHSTSGHTLLHVETTDLQVLPKQRQAGSKTKVTMKTDYATIAATGFSVDLSRGELKFLHEAHGRYY